MLRRAPLQRHTPLRRTGAPLRSHRPKRRAGHAPAYLAACRGEACYLRLPDCRSYAGDATVVPAHRNMGKGMGLKVPDQYTVPACHHCHALYDQSGLDRDYKRAAWDWAYTRWEPVRARKMEAA